MVHTIMRVFLMLTLAVGALSSKIVYYAKYRDGTKMRHSSKSAQLASNQVAPVLTGMKTWSESKYTATKLKRGNAVQVINVEPAESKAEAQEMVTDMQVIVGKHLQKLAGPGSAAFEDDE